MHQRGFACFRGNKKQNKRGQRKKKRKRDNPGPGWDGRCLDWNRTGRINVNLGRKKHREPDWIKQVMARWTRARTRRWSLRFLHAWFMMTPTNQTETKTSAHPSPFTLELELIINQSYPILSYPENPAFCIGIGICISCIACMMILIDTDWYCYWVILSDTLFLVENIALHLHCI